MVGRGDGQRKIVEKFPESHGVKSTGNPGDGNLNKFDIHPQHGRGDNFFRKEIKETGILYIYVNFYNNNK